MNKKIITLMGVVALIASIVMMNIQSANASTYADGSIAGKAKGHSDAINGRAANDRCGSGNSNDYCLGYKVAYNTEYWWTKLVQDPTTSPPTHMGTEDESQYLTCSEWYEEMKKSSFLDYRGQSEFNEFKNECSYLFSGNNSSN